MARIKRHHPPSSSPSAADSDSDAVPHSPTASEFTVAPILRNPNDDVDEGGAKKSSGRIWCEEDEVAILTGAIDFKAEHGGADPTVDKSGFHGFMKTKLKADVSRSQLMDKLRRLKNKYYDDQKARRGRYSRAHDVGLVDLAVKIWAKKKAKKDEEVVAGEKIVEVDVVNGGKTNEDVLSDDVDDDDDGDEDEKEEVFDWARYPFLKESMEFEHLGVGLRRYMMERMPSIGSATAEEWNEKWKELKLAEVELESKRYSLVAEVTEAVVKALKRVVD